MPGYGGGVFSLLLVSFCFRHEPCAEERGSSCCLLNFAANDEEISPRPIAAVPATEYSCSCFEESGTGACRGEILGGGVRAELPRGAVLKLSPVREVAQAPLTCAYILTISDSGMFLYGSLFIVRRGDFFFNFTTPSLLFDFWSCSFGMMTPEGPRSAVLSYANERKESYVRNCKVWSRHFLSF